MIRNFPQLLQQSIQKIYFSFSPHQYTPVSSLHSFVITAFSGNVGQCSDTLRVRSMCQASPHATGTEEAEGAS